MDNNLIVQDNNNNNNDLKEKLQARIQLMKEHLVSNTNASFDMANELKYIHTTLKSNPMVTYLLSDTDIGVIVQGFSKEANLVMIAPKVKKPKAASAALSLDDF